MNVRSSHQRPGRKVASISAFVPVAICAFAITLTSAAQQAAPAPTPAAADTKVQFKPLKIPALQAGKAYAFNLCSGTEIKDLPAKFTDADGLKLDNQQSPCGEKQGPSNVSGGNPPYSFQWATGGFPPLGMHLTSNGLLYGTPAPHIGGYPPFKVCAVDVGTRSDCREVEIEQPTAAENTAARQAAKHSNTPLLIGLLGGAAVVGVVASREMSSASSSSGSGDSAGQCDGFGSTINSCGPCTCGATSACTDSTQCGGGQCFRYSEDGNQPAPFCSAK